MNKKIITVLFALLILFVAGGYLFFQYTIPPKTFRDYFGMPEYMTVDPDKPLATQTSIVEIGERIFEIPTVYIQTNLEGKRKQDGVNLLYVYPDFTSRADFENKQEYEKAWNDRRLGSMSIQIAKKFPTPSQMIENNRKFGQEIKFENIEHGLERHSSPKRDGKYAIEPDDTYLEKDENGTIISFLRCSKDGQKKFPGCRHKFVDKDMLYNISYNKEKFLPSWREHKEKAIEFIDSFEIKTSQ